MSWADLLWLQPPQIQSKNSKDVFSRISDVCLAIYRHALSCTLRGAKHMAVAHFRTMHESKPST